MLPRVRTVPANGDLPDEPDRQVRVGYIQREDIQRIRHWTRGLLPQSHQNRQLLSVQPQLSRAY